MSDTGCPHPVDDLVSIETEQTVVFVPSWSPSSVLHLKTQRNQPYGSVRKCCERCGIALVPPEPLPWTADEQIYNNPPTGFTNCNSQ
jgi:hypothetical protein